MFYVARTIKFSVFLDLLWKHILIVCYKLNMIWPPYQFDICVLLFGGYTRFIPLDKIVFYG